MQNPDFTPFVPAEKKVSEFNLSSILMGCVLGIIFGASSLYLALKVGMTVSASIPVAVLSITLFKGLSKAFGLKRKTILENNIVQTTGSAGESIAFGVAVTMPALMMMGFEMDMGRIMLVACLGSVLGILMMIPLRYVLIVQNHKKLAYPEGTACAEVLIAGEKGGTTAKYVFAGFFIGLFYKVLNVGSKVWKEVAEKTFGWYKGSGIAAEVSPELLGVGYIIGPRIAAITFAGGILSSFVLIPAIKLFGDGIASPLFPATKLISEMTIREIWKNYVLYIGAGAVAAGGLISLVQSLPTIIRSAGAALGGFKRTKGGYGFARTEIDLPMKYVLVGCFALIATIFFIPTLHMNLIGAVLIVLAGFLFVTVSSRLTGEIGSSSNPISGMTVATLLITSLVFLSLGWTSPQDRITALTIAAIVCVAASIGGTTSQDLKTGFLVGATPKFQQIALVFGALSSSLVIGYTLNELNQAATIYSKNAVPQNVVVENVQSLTHMEKAKGTNDETNYHVLYVREPATEGPLASLAIGKYLVDDTGKVTYLVDPGINGALKQRDDGTSVEKYDAPKAQLMSLIIDGILTQKLPWGLVLLGVFIAIMLQLCGIPVLPFAVGVYLPISTSTPIFIGGMVRWCVGFIRGRRKEKVSEAEEESGPGVLLSSGLIAGGAIAGIALAIALVSPAISQALDMSHVMGSLAENDLFATVVFLSMAAILLKVGLKRAKA